MEVIETIGTSLQWYVNIISRVVLIVECTRNIYFATSCEWSFSYIFGFALLAKLTIFTRRDYKPDMLTWTLQTTRLHKHKEIFHTFFWEHTQTEHCHTYHLLSIVILTVNQPIWLLIDSLQRYPKISIRKTANTSRCEVGYTHNNCFNSTFAIFHLINWLAIILSDSHQYFHSLTGNPPGGKTLYVSLEFQSNKQLNEAKEAWLVTPVGPAETKNITERWWCYWQLDCSQTTLA